MLKRNSTANNQQQPEKCYQQQFFFFLNSEILHGKLIEYKHNYYYYAAIDSVSATIGSKNKLFSICTCCNHKQLLLHSALLFRLHWIGAI